MTGISPHLDKVAADREDARQALHDEAEARHQADRDAFAAAVAEAVQFGGRPTQTFEGDPRVG